MVNKSNITIKCAWNIR